MEWDLTGALASLSVDDGAVDVLGLNNLVEGESTACEGLTPCRAQRTLCLCPDMWACSWCEELTDTSH